MEKRSYVQGPSWQTIVFWDGAIFAGVQVMSGKATSDMTCARHMHGPCIVHTNKTMATWQFIFSTNMMNSSCHKTYLLEI